MSRDDVVRCGALFVSLRDDDDRLVRLDNLELREHELNALMEFASDAPSDDATSLLVLTLRAVSRTSQERAVVAAIATNQFDTWAEIDRNCRWSLGQARVFAMRLAKRVRRAA